MRGPRLLPKNLSYSLSRHCRSVYAGQPKIEMEDPGRSRLMQFAFWRVEKLTLRARRFGSMSLWAPSVTIFAFALVSSSLTLGAQPRKTVRDGVYTGEQAKRGQAIYMDRCSPCHGETLEGDIAPALAGNDFIGDWDKQPLSDLASKIQNTMPANDPGRLTRPQTADIVAYILQVGKFPVGRAELAADEAVLKQITWPAGSVAQPTQVTPTLAQALSSRPVGNLSQVMRGILFPSSNLIFDVQTVDPSVPQKNGAADAGATVAFGNMFAGWQRVENAAVALEESAYAIMMPGRRCENGKPVPVQQPDWVKYTQALAEAGRATYKAAQSRDRDAVIEVTNQVADACLNCHVAYRDKPGGKAVRCVP
jgi:mono/diheme cytochrome c family protein